MRWRITDNLCRHYIMGRIEDARETVKVTLEIPADSRWGGQSE
jgi:hypothetical protein